MNQNWSLVKNAFKNISGARALRPKRRLFSKNDNPSTNSKDDDASNIDGNQQQPEVDDKDSSPNYLSFDRDSNQSTSKRKPGKKGGNGKLKGIQGLGDRGTEKSEEVSEDDTEETPRSSSILSEDSLHRSGDLDTSVVSKEVERSTEAQPAYLTFGVDDSDDERQQKGMPDAETSKSHHEQNRENPSKSRKKKGKNPQRATKATRHVEGPDEEIAHICRALGMDVYKGFCLRHTTESISQLCLRYEPVTECVMCASEFQANSEIMEKQQASKAVILAAVHQIQANAEDWRERTNSLHWASDSAWNNDDALDHCSSFDSGKEEILTEKKWLDQVVARIMQVRDWKYLGQTPLRHDPEYARYFRLLRVGVPLDAIKFTVDKDGFDPSVMDLSPDLPLESQRQNVDMQSPNTTQQDDVHAFQSFKSGNFATYSKDADKDTNSMLQQVERILIAFNSMRSKELFLASKPVVKTKGRGTRQQNKKNKGSGLGLRSKSNKKTRYSRKSKKGQEGKGHLLDPPETDHKASARGQMTPEADEKDLLIQKLKEELKVKEMEIESLHEKVNEMEKNRVMGDNSSYRSFGIVDSESLSSLPKKLEKENEIHVSACTSAENGSIENASSRQLIEDTDDGLPDERKDSRDQPQHLETETSGSVSDANNVMSNDGVGCLEQSQDIEVPYNNNDLPFLSEYERHSKDSVEYTTELASATSSSCNVREGMSLSESSGSSNIDFLVKSEFETKAKGAGSADDDGIRASPAPLSNDVAAESKKFSTVPIEHNPASRYETDSRGESSSDAYTSGSSSSNRSFMSSRSDHVVPSTAGKHACAPGTCEENTDLNSDDSNSNFSFGVNGSITEECGVNQSSCSDSECSSALSFTGAHSSRSSVGKSGDDGDESHSNEDSFSNTREAFVADTKRVDGENTRNGDKDSVREDSAQQTMEKRKGDAVNIDLGDFEVSVEVMSASEHISVDSSGNENIIPNHTTEETHTQSVLEGFENESGDSVGNETSSQVQILPIDENSNNKTSLNNDDLVDEGGGDFQGLDSDSRMKPVKKEIPCLQSKQYEDISRTKRLVSLVEVKREDVVTDLGTECVDKNEDNEDNIATTERLDDRTDLEAFENEENCKDSLVGPTETEGTPNNKSGCDSISGSKRTEVEQKSVESTSDVVKLEDATNNQAEGFLIWRGGSLDERDVNSDAQVGESLEEDDTRSSHTSFSNQISERKGDNQELKSAGVYDSHGTDGLSFDNPAEAIRTLRTATNLTAEVAPPLTASFILQTNTLLNPEDSDGDADELLMAAALFAREDIEETSPNRKQEFGEESDGDNSMEPESSDDEKQVPNYESDNSSFETESSNANKQYSDYESNDDSSFEPESSDDCSHETEKQEHRGDFSDGSESYRSYDSYDDDDDDDSSDSAP